MEEKNGPENMEEYQNGEGKRQIRKRKMAATVVTVAVAAVVVVAVAATVAMAVVAVVSHY